MEAVTHAMPRLGVCLPFAFLRLDDSTLWDSAMSAKTHGLP
jgi:hypothetical protein